MSPPNKKTPPIPVSYRQWLGGDPTVMPVVVDALASLAEAAKATPHDDVRKAVAAQQKRWGEPPTGWLDAPHLARLGDESGLFTVGD